MLIKKVLNEKKNEYRIKKSQTINNEVIESSSTSTQEDPLSPLSLKVKDFEFQEIKSNEKDVLHNYVFRSTKIKRK